MLTEKPKAAKEHPSAGVHGATTPSEGSVAYFQGEYVALADAKVSVLTHSFMYGTAVFEGIRAYWNPEQGVLYGLKLREHM
jgi:branched-chain amino acid aminotransferase